MSSELPSAPSEDRERDRLESWKEIATYLRRGVTTVQRWEQQEGLPVRRHAHAKKGSVHAYRTELDQWRRSRTTLLRVDSGTALTQSNDEPQAPLAETLTDNAAAILREASLVQPGRRFATWAVPVVIVVVFGLVGFSLYKSPAADVPVDVQRWVVTESSANSPLLTRVRLQNATATFSQAILGGPFSPSQAIDQYFNPSNGWTIAREAADKFGSTQAETAVWETVTDVMAADLTFNLYYLHFNPRHLLGRFRLSVTGDHRDLFADELHTGGDVDANWVVLQSPVVTGPPGMTFKTLADHSVLAGGVTADRGVYSVSYHVNPSRITGVRLEALKDPSLPGGGGPGLYAPSGNFFLTEIEMMVAEQAFTGRSSTPRTDYPSSGVSPAKYDRLAAAARGR